MGRPMKWSTIVLVAVLCSGLAALLGTLAWFDWLTLQEQRQVIARGVETQAEIKGAREVRTRGDTRYLVNATWKDNRGARRTRDVNVTKTFFQEVEAGRKIASIKYLPAEPRMRSVFVDDAAALESDQLSRVQGRVFALLVGFAVGGLLLWRRRSATAAHP